MVRMTLPRAFASAVLALAALAAVAAPPDSLFILEVKGGARVFALDRPAQQGRTLVFHRHPDGVFTSLPSAEVVRVMPGTSAALPRSPKIGPGDLLVLGNDIDGSAPTAVGLPPQPIVYQAPGTYDMGDYGYDGSYGYGGGYPGRPSHHPRPPHPQPTPLPMAIGPNGFPIIAPPGAPGSAVPPTGSNGFPIISPPPPPSQQPPQPVPIREPR